MRFEGKKVLITGATGGIGQAIVSAFLKEGAIVCASGSNQNKLSELSNHNSLIKTIQCDLSNTEEVKNLIKKTHELLDGLDILVCNAGITKDNLSLRMSLEDWQKVIDINLTSAFILNKEAAGVMRKQKYGRVINMASIIGLMGNVGQVNYSASKAGLIGMTKSFAREYASYNITFNAVAPGFVATEMTAKIPEEILHKMLENVPLKRQGDANEIAHGVLFLADENSSYITGETLNINGGLLMD